MSKHTPGHWNYVPHENGVEFDIVTRDEGPRPWYIAATHDMEGASEANARLIAAAPLMKDTLEIALTSLVAMYGSLGGNPEDSYAVKKIRAVLSQVEGSHD